MTDINVNSAIGITLAAIPEVKKDEENLSLILEPACKTKKIFENLKPAFCIINQTDKDRTLILEEAYRPAPKKAGSLEYPISLNKKPKELLVPAKSYFAAQINPCSLLLLRLKEISLQEGNTKGTVQETTSTTTRCYGAYDFKEKASFGISDIWSALSFTQKKVSEIDNTWGLLIHDSIPDPMSRFLPSGLIRDYEIRILDPTLLEKVDSLEALPEELKPKPVNFFQHSRFA
ncbi:hypothetical protein AB751O23_AX_00060 [Chlamydiales bacterium SCGC AB-751-O23]|jgi:hypothetical protein|nr:hypothetical protein AB751O23_AX_00060 [Chlamydiales bacterium SCGC AB-751-O23]